MGFGFGFGGGDGGLGEWGHVMGINSISDIHIRVRL